MSKKDNLDEEMMGVAAIAGIGAGGEPNNPDLSWRDEPAVDKKKLLMFKRQLRRKRQSW